MRGSSPRMTKPSARLVAVRDEGGMERPSRATTLILNNGAGPLHPGGFWRSLSRHSLRDVSKPRRPSTQPLVNDSQSTTAYRHRPFLHTQGVIRTAPPSRSRVKNDYSILGMLSRRNIPLPLVGRGKGWGAASRSRPHPVFASLRHPSPQGGGKEIPAGSRPTMTLLVTSSPGLTR